MASESTAEGGDNFVIGRWRIEDPRKAIRRGEARGGVGGWAADSAPRSMRPENVQNFMSKCVHFCVLFDLNLLLWSLSSSNTRLPKSERDYLLTTK